VQVQLVFVWFEGVQHFDVGVLHADGQPFAGRTITQREYLCGRNQIELNLKQKKNEKNDERYNTAGGRNKWETDTT